MPSGFFTHGGNLLRWLDYLRSGKGPPLEGLWERVGDRFHGCRVKVTFENKRYYARVTKVPPKMHYFGWNSGEYKWRSIRPLSSMLYTALDLYKVMDKKSGAARELYREARIEFFDDNTLKIRSIDKKDKTFPDQTWRRLTLSEPPGLSTENDKKP